MVSRMTIARFPAASSTRARKSKSLTAKVLALEGSGSGRDDLPVGDVGV